MQTQGEGDDQGEDFKESDHRLGVDDDKEVGDQQDGDAWLCNRLEAIYLQGSTLYFVWMS